jgi:hypothetical protein
MKRILYLPLFLFFILSCGKSSLEEVLVDPKNANEVAKIILTPSGGETKQGTPPVTTTTSGTLVLNTQPDATNSGTQSTPTTQIVTAAQGATVYMTMTYVCGANSCESIRTNLKASGTPYCIYRVKGSDSYIIYPYTTKFGSNGNLKFPFTLPDNIGNGTFSVDFSIVDEYGFVANYNTTTVNVKRLADADNPAKAYGCDFQKSSNELLAIYDKWSLSASIADCEAFKIKYNSLVTAILGCNQIPQASKDQLKDANASIQSIKCR